jgi:ferredoxin
MSLKCARRTAAGVERLIGAFLFGWGGAGRRALHMALVRCGLYNFTVFPGVCSARPKRLPFEDCISMPVVTFVNEKKEIEVPAGSNLRTEAKKAGISVYKGIDKYLNCMGFGLCGTCRVLVKSGMGNLSPKSFMEKVNLNLHPLTMFAAIGHENEIRLACQVTVNGDCSIETTPAFNLEGENFWQKPYPNK